MPGALVEAVDAAGSVLASATADLSGAWSMTDFPALPVGTSTVRLRQTVDTVVSAVSAPADVTMAPPPVVSQPAEGAVVDATDFVMQLTGASGADAQRIVNGAVRETPMPLTDGTWLGSFSIAQGPVNLGIRYLDPVTGRFGLTATRLFTAQ
ncbi:hypothetical protein [Subtercola sp. RTI3]|uniref:hypothetical protein n=1 Tax=Subtercola sp. RTI3 TaxID=3048639 RepID=UPI002B237076|nr:hypothetical protein [Subtercola sp. RTI3]MEA9987223.1 hypothetical protein [Subtercola sp. RTI3]